MNGKQEWFGKHLKKANINYEIIEQIINVTYQRSEDEKQDNANFYAAVMEKCDELLDFDVIAEVMFDKACCKSGYRLNNAKMIAKEHGNKSLEEKLELLGQQQYMGKPRLTENGDIYTGTCAGSGPPEDIKCSCWQFGGRFPADKKMPLSYCLCCGGHFRFHYQKALGLKLRVKEVVTSIFGEPRQYCSFLLEIVGEIQKKPKKTNHKEAK